MTAGHATVGAARLRSLVFSLLVLATTVMALASTQEPRSLDQLVRDSDLIVRGRVQSLSPRRSTADGPSTAVVILVQEQWKGPKRSKVSLVQPRGTEGGITREVSGIPRFQLREEVILFLVKDPATGYEVVGGEQGKFSVKTDPQSGKRMVEDRAGSRLDLTRFVDALRAALKERH